MRTRSNAPNGVASVYTASRRQRSSSDPGAIAEAMELIKRSTVCARQKCDFIGPSPVTFLLATYRESTDPGHRKEDPKDVAWALNHVLRYPKDCAVLRLRRCARCCCRISPAISA